MFVKSHMQQINTLPFIIPVNPVLEEKEAGYDDWLRDHLKSTIKQLDSGGMASFTNDEVQAHIEKRRADWRTSQQTTVKAK
jgi:hypothetical protein